MDLFAYLDSLPPAKVRRGDFIVLTNIWNEKQVWRWQDIEPYQPVLVIGIDHERNLFRMTMFYRMSHEYSWKQGAPPPVMARPVGAFVHFLKQPPAPLQPKVWHSGLMPDSFRLASEDPLRPLGDLPTPVFEALTYRNGCIFCHSFRGVGSRSHHNLAATGEPHGGFALPLEQYPREVWREFVFNQEQVARKMGATPNTVAKEARQLLYDLVEEQAHGRPQVISDRSPYVAP